MAKSEQGPGRKEKEGAIVSDIKTFDRLSAVLDLIGVQTTPLKTKEGPKAVNGGLLVLKHRTGGATGESILWLLRVYRLLILSDARPLLASLNSRSGFQTLKQSRQAKPARLSNACRLGVRPSSSSRFIESASCRISLRVRRQYWSYCH